MPASQQTPMMGHRHKYCGGWVVFRTEPGYEFNEWRAACARCDEPVSDDFETEPVEVVPAADALTAEELATQLDEMQLFDNTGNCFDEGYMAAVRELRVWLRRIAEDSKEGNEDG